MKARIQVLSLILVLFIVFAQISRVISTPLIQDSPKTQFHTLAPPSQVQGVVVSNEGSGDKLNITWQANLESNINHYNVYRNLTVNVTISLINLVGSTNFTSYLDTNLMDNLTYYYRITAVNNLTEEGPPSDEVFGIPLDVMPPDPVTTFTASPMADGSMRLDWTALIPPDFVAYNIYRIQGINQAFATSPTNLIHSEYDNTTLFYLDSHENLLDDVYYTYKIAVADEVGDSPTACDFNKTIGDITSPTAPNGLTVMNEGTGDIMNISWNVNPELDVHHYNLYRNITATTYIQIAMINGRTTTFYQDIGLVEYPATNYRYYLTAVDDVNNEGPPSNIEFDVTNDTKPPGPPTILIDILIPLYKLVIYFEPPSDPDVMCYNIYRYNTTLDEWELIGEHWVSTFYIDWDWPFFDMCAYYVTALDEKYQESLPSNILNLTITVSLYAPEWVYANISINANGDIRLEWTDHVLNDLDVVAGYLLYRMNASEAIPILISNITTKLIHEYDDYGVPNGDWSYFIRTYSLFGTISNYSIPINFTVVDTLGPEPPRNLRRTTPNGIENLTLVWDPPLDTNYGADVLIYEIYISPSFITDVPGWLPNITLVGQIYFNGTIWDAPVTTCTFTNFADGLYYFAVVARDELNQASNISNVINHTVDTTDPYIDPASITDVTGVEITAGQPLEISINVTDAGGIYSVWLNYTIDGISQPAIQLILVSIGSNNTQLYRTPVGSFTAPSVGQTVNYSITVFDFYGHSVTSTLFTFTVFEEDFSWVYILLLIVIGGTIGAAIVVYRRLRTAAPKVSEKSKEKEGSQEKSTSLKSTLVKYGKKIPKLFNVKRKKK